MVSLPSSFISTFEEDIIVKLDIFFHEEKETQKSAELLYSIIELFYGNISFLINQFSIKNKCILEEDNIILFNLLADFFKKIEVKYNLIKYAFEKQNFGFSEMKKTPESKENFIKYKNTNILLISLIWELTIGHERNKKLFNDYIKDVIEELEFYSKNIINNTNTIFKPDKIENDLLIIISCIWSLNYGITDTQIKTVKLNGHLLLSEILNKIVSNNNFTNIKNTSNIKNAIIGALWHITNIPISVNDMINTGIISTLIKVIKNNIDKKIFKMERLPACFLLGNLTTFYSHNDENNKYIDDVNAAFKAMHEYIISFNLDIEKNTFVWTNFNPLITLINSDSYAVNRELAGIMFYFLSKDSTSYIRLFQEGVIERMKQLIQIKKGIIKDSNINVSDTEFSLYNQIFKNMHITIDNTENFENIFDFTKKYHLQFADEIFRKNNINKIEQILKFSEVDFKNLNLDEKQIKYISSTIKCVYDKDFIQKTIKDNQNDKTCLLCCQANKNCFLIPCLHFICCSLCKDIMISKGEKCPFCRTKIYNSIVINI